RQPRHELAPRHGDLLGRGQLGPLRGRGSGLDAERFREPADDHQLGLFSDGDRRRRLFPGRGRLLSIGALGRDGASALPEGGRVDMSRATVGSILADLFAQCGLSPSQYDVTAATDSVDGFVINQRSDARENIEGLLKVYDTFLVEVDGKLKAVK